MDQSEMLTLISGLYDKLVADVAQRVITKDRKSTRLNSSH